MMLLSAVILNAPLAANPLLAAPAIVRTFRPYIGVLLIFASALLLLHWASSVGRLFGTFGHFLVRYVTFYAWVLAMHVLGLFYGRFEKEIGWFQD